MGVSWIAVNDARREFIDPTSKWPAFVDVLAQRAWPGEPYRVISDSGSTQDEFYDIAEGQDLDGRKLDWKARATTAHDRVAAVFAAETMDSEADGYWLPETDLSR
jgi:hypothetical protein